MAGKLKIVRVLANPRRAKKKTKARKRAKPMRRKSPLRARPQSRGDYVVRLVGAGGAAQWWNGAKWCSHRGKAKHYKNPAATRAALTTAKKKAPAGWVVIDGLPA